MLWLWVPQAIICNYVYFAEGARKSNFASIVVLPKQSLYHLKLTSQLMVVFPWFKCHYILCNVLIFFKYSSILKNMDWLSPPTLHPTVNPLATCLQDKYPQWYNSLYWGSITYTAPSLTGQQEGMCTNIHFRRIWTQGYNTQFLLENIVNTLSLDWMTRQSF
jgi:hypothetical protein